MIMNAKNGSRNGPKETLLRLNKDKRNMVIYVK